MSGAIAVFVKTPGISPVKTRLVVKVGRKNAEALYLASSRSVSSVVQVLSKLEDIHSYYAVAEDKALNHHYWRDLPCLWQGEGGLGERMAFIYEKLLDKHDFVILVGSDIPQMTAKHLLTASANLTHNEQQQFVFGPSVDGGFWLFGGNSKIPSSIWTDVTYSVADTGAQFFNIIEQFGGVKTLASLRDVDEVEDLAPLREDLLNLTEPLPAQQDLVAFLDELSAFCS